MSTSFSHEPTITVSSTAIIKAIVVKTIKLLFSFIVLGFVVYLALGTVLLRYMHVPDTGFVLAKDFDYAGGKIPTDDENKQVVVVDLEKTHNNGILDDAAKTLIPNSSLALVEVQSGPSGNIMWHPDGSLFVNEKKIPAEITGYEPTEMNPTGNPFIAKEKLENEYLGVCLSGACEEGRIVIFSKDNVAGIPLKENDLPSPEDMLKNANKE